MIILNHQHLYYFWMVAREGSITKACEKLYLGQPTVSAQIIQLEKSLGKKLFYRDKKRMILTEEGRIALGYANDIFGITRELVNHLRDQPSQVDLSLHLGVDASVSKQIMVRLVESIYLYKPNAHVMVQEGAWPDLLEGLQTHALDVVLSEQGQTGLGRVDTDYQRTEVGQLGIVFVATPRFAGHVKSFPADLSKVSLLLPTRESPIWASVDQFLTHYKVQPHVVAEVGDTELLRLLALRGLGAAPLPDVAVAADLRAKRLVRLGRGSLGIIKRLWLVARKRQPPNAAVQYLMENFRLKQIIEGIPAS
jgi:LysR family transcriptional regulator, transcriptional activator of nhaA